jgi:hypothetical protein
MYIMYYVAMSNMLLLNKAHSVKERL